MGDCARSLILLCAVVGSLSIDCTNELVAQQPEFPYQALVVTDGAQVFSGPGTMHYGTEELRQGEMVQVHRHDPGGWCAIRPTETSFSLIPEPAIVIIGENVGEVVEQGIQVWVGTGLGPVENPLWQVKLKAGERIKLLGEVSWPDPEGHSNIWYQIAPPDGEFRWIHLDDIQLPATKLPEEFDSQTSRDQTVGIHHRPTESELNLLSNDGWRPAKVPFKTQSKIRLASAEQEIGAGNQNQTIQSMRDRTNGQPAYQYDSAVVFDEQPNSDGFVTPQIERNVSDQLFASQDTLNVRDRPIPVDRGNLGYEVRHPPGERFASSDSAFGGMPVGQSLNSLSSIEPLVNISLTQRLQEIDLQLSKEVIKPTEQWQLQSIGVETQRIINSPQNDSERTAAERLLEKVKNFTLIQSNSRRANGSGSVSSSGLPTASGTVGTGVAKKDEYGNIYDASGWLNELVQKRGAVDSTYVLQNDSGTITHHVQAAPGLNLNRYLRSKVGLIGKRGFHSQLNLDHIEVERIIVLEKPRQ